MEKEKPNPRQIRVMNDQIGQKEKAWDEQWINGSVYNCFGNFVQVRDRDIGWFGLVGNPTGNCQVSCISYMEALLQTDNPIQAMYDLWRSYQKPLWLIDIREELEKTLEKYISKKDIVFKNRYRSTNESEMTMYLVNVGDKFEEWMYQGREQSPAYAETIRREATIQKELEEKKKSTKKAKKIPEFNDLFEDD